MIRSLTVANLGPFKGEQHIELRSGLLSIEGRYIDKPGESNRAGKSSFLDLIRFGYFGVHRHRTLQQYIHRNADPRNDPIYLSMEVEDREGHVYHIIREFDYSKQTFVTRIPEIEGVSQLKQSEIQKDIEHRLLGCSYEDATRTWMVLQDDAKGLMNQSVAERKRFLLELFSPHMFPWDSYFSEASARYTMCLTRQSEIMSRINSLNNRLMSMSTEDHEKSVASVKAEIDTIDDRKDTVKQLLADLEASNSKAALRELNAKVAADNRKLGDMHAALILSRKTLDKLSKDLERLQNKREMLADLQVKQKTLENKAKKLRLQEIEDEYTQVYDQHKELGARLSLDIQKYKDIDKFSGICPITYQDCPSGQDIDKTKARLKKQIEHDTDIVDDLQKKLDKLASKIDSVEKVRRDLDIITNNIDATLSVIESLEGVADMYEEHKEQNKLDEHAYVMFKEQVEKLRAELEARRTDHDLTHQRRVRELKQELQTLERKRQELDGRLITLISDHQRKLVLEQDLEDSKLEHKQLESREQALRSLKPMLSPNGIPFTNLLSSIIDFEAEINKALLDLGDDMIIDIEPYTITTTKEPICRVCGYDFGKSTASKCPIVTCQSPREFKKKETLDVKIRGRLFDVDFDEDSGGGKQKVAIAIRLALFNVLKERGMMENVDIWYLDEIFAPLSEVGKFNMLNALENVCARYDIRQMFLVTHTDISSIVPPAVIIERSEQEQESHIIT